MVQVSSGTSLSGKSRLTAWRKSMKSSFWLYPLPWPHKHVPTSLMLSCKSVRSSSECCGAWDASLCCSMSAGWVIAAFSCHGGWIWRLLTGQEMMPRQQRRTCNTCWVCKELKWDLPVSASVCHRCVYQKKSIYLGCCENSVISLWEIIKLYKALDRHHLLVWMMSKLLSKQEYLDIGAIFLFLGWEQNLNNTEFESKLSMREYI